MKLSSNTPVLHLTYEGITNFTSLLDFDKKSIQLLPQICKNRIAAIVKDLPNNITAKAVVSRANISLISGSRLIIAINTAKYYNSIVRAMNPQNMNQTNVLNTFKIKYEAYISIKGENKPKVLKIKDKDYDRRIIRQAPIFRDCLASTFGSCSPLSYSIRKDSNVLDEITDLLLPSYYYGVSGSQLSELEPHLPHNGLIYKNDNSLVYIKIEEVVCRTSKESTIKPFSCCKDG